MTTPENPPPVPENQTRKRLRTTLFILIALAVVSTSAAIILLMRESSGMEKTESDARKVAEKELEAYAAGDWCAAWELWTDEGKASISCEDFARLEEECGAITGIPFTIKDVRVKGDVATIRVERAGFLGTYELLWEEGEWRWQPDEQSLADYERGVDELVKEC